MLKIRFTNKMKRDVKLLKKSGKHINKLTDILNLLVTQGPMPERYFDHQLTGLYKDFRECYIEPDWLLVYQVSEDTLILSASGIGTHSNLFS